MVAATSARLDAISPFFIVADVPRSIDFYRGSLGFSVHFVGPGDPTFFAMIGRDAVQLFLKSGEGVDPLPNPVRDREMRWDAFVHVAEPDALAAEFAARGVPVAKPLADTHDGLRGFEIDDPDRYRLFFGRPR